MRSLSRLTAALAPGLATLLVATVGIAGVGAQGDAPPVRIGSDDFSESRLVAEIYAQALEAGGYEVEREFGIGTRIARVAAFEAGRIDLAPEYVGSGLSHYVAGSDDPALGGIEVSPDGEVNRDNLQATYDVLGIDATVLAIAPGEDTNVAVVRQSTADAYGLRLMSDLSRVQDELAWGLPRECDVSPLCKDALERYAIAFPPAKRGAYEACGPSMADALALEAIDVAWLCSTQPEIEVNDFVVLIDDLDTQPAENIAPVARDEWLDRVEGGRGAIARILDPVSDRLTNEALAEMGVMVSIDGQPIEAVAREFLAEAVEG